MVKSNADALYRLRHSAAHILAQAVLDLFPGTKIAIGPPIKDGFYYDFDCDKPFTPEDLARLEEKMSDIIRQDQRFEQRPVSKSEARQYFKKVNQPYKLEMLEALPDGEITLVQNGSFVDLCEGGHLENTGELKAFKLLSVAGAYWRGSEKNRMLQRIYGTAFPTPDELNAYLKQLEEAQKRDHRKLGKLLDLISFHSEAPGMVFYHPKGRVVYDLMVGYWRQEHEKEGYLEIRTPVMLKDELWRQSGHYDHYRDNMFFSKVDEENYAVRPMNCPGGTLVYRNDQRSYKDLPLRLAELGLVHRRELSGVLHGMFRVNAFTIDDAHIYCTEEQIQDEISKCIALILRIYKTFGFSKVKISLSTRPDDFMGSVATWEKATESLKKGLEQNEIDFDIHEGGGAFYGPKIDFEITDSIGREWQCGTIQLDFQMPQRFNLSYIDPQGQKVWPVMVHRAVFGSIERFYGILIENYAGAFPVWLAPVQVRVLTISDRHIGAAQQVEERMREAGIRVEPDFRTEKIGYKIRDAEIQKIPYVAVIGDREAEAGTVSVRSRGRQDLGSMGVDALVERVQKENRGKI